MPIVDKIMHHEDWKNEPYLRFLATLWAKNGFGKLPVLSEANIRGSVLARVNQGRWVAECGDGCGFAVVVSRETPYLICCDHGPMCNDSKWWAVQMPEPSLRIEIEAALVERPAKHPFWADSRNWTPGETVKQLKAENEAHSSSSILRRGNAESDSSR